MPEEEDDDMDEDEEEPEPGAEVAGTRDTPIDVVAEVGASREVPNPVEVNQKPRVGEASTGTLPKRGAEAASTMGQWASSPPNYRRMVVVDESSVVVSRRERCEVVETTPVARST